MVMINWRCRHLKSISRRENNKRRVWMNDPGEACSLSFVRQLLMCWRFQLRSEVFSCGVLMMCSFRTACSTDLHARVHRNLAGDRKKHQSLSTNTAPRHRENPMCAGARESGLLWHALCQFLRTQFGKTTECFVFVHFVYVSL